MKKVALIYLLFLTLLGSRFTGTAPCPIIDSQSDVTPSGPDLKCPAGYKLGVADSGHELCYPG